MTLRRLHVTLDEASAQKLSAMASRMHLNEATLARSLLTAALDEADPETANIVALLDGISGEWEDAQDGWGRLRRATPSPWTGCSNSHTERGPPPP